MGRACSKNGDMRNAYKIFVGSALQAVRVNVTHSSSTQTQYIRQAGGEHTDEEEGMKQLSH
jgi:hypothetical protein